MTAPQNPGAAVAWMAFLPSNGLLPFPAGPVRRTESAARLDLEALSEKARGKAWVSPVHLGNPEHPAEQEPATQVAPTRSSERANA